jgi:hypothetical protein
MEWGYVMGLNKVLIDKYASKGRSRIISEFKEKYLSKKGDRFFVGGITYEIGQLFQEKDEMEMEISSKIPVDEITEKNKKKFFGMVEGKLQKQESPPYYIGMDDIVKKIGEREIKKRDYIRLKYRAKVHGFHDDKAIIKEAERIAREQDMKEIPPIQEVSSIPGKLVLAAVEEGFYLFIRDKVNEMVEANQEAKKKYAAAGAAT